jgi:hypothetical protein
VHRIKIKNRTEQKVQNMKKRRKKGGVTRKQGAYC